MAPPKDDKPADPRSLRTDRAQFMVRSLHTVRIVKIVALKLADEKGIGPTEAVRRACRFLEIPDDYDPEVDPTMKACVKQVREALERQ